MTGIPPSPPKESKLNVNLFSMNISFTKEELPKMNKKLNRIRKPKDLK